MTTLYYSLVTIRNYGLFYNIQCSTSDFTEEHAQSVRRCLNNPYKYLKDDNLSSMAREVIKNENISKIFLRVHYGLDRFRPTEINDDGEVNKCEAELISYTIKITKKGYHG